MCEKNHYLHNSWKHYYLNLIVIPQQRSCVDSVFFFECYTDKQSCCQTLIESWNSYSCKTLLRSSTSSHHAMSVKPHAYVADQSCLLSARKVRILISTSLICQSSQLFFRFFFTNLCDLLFMDDLKTFLCNTGKSER